MTTKFNTTMTEHITPHAHDTQAIRDLMAAALAAVKAATQSDLQDMAVLSGSRGAWDDLPQELQRDLLAMHRLYGVSFGPVSASTRRPEITDLRTHVIPSGDDWLILVLSTGGDAAIYRPDGREAVLRMRGSANQMIEAITPFSGESA